MVGLSFYMTTPTLFNNILEAKGSQAKEYNYYRNYLCESISDHSLVVKSWNNTKQPSEDQS